jgi:membrane-bound metal-dependent hydrolase YbcI (DUF457 family)
MVGGTIGSVAFLLRVIHRNQSRLLIAGFVLWVVSPFVALALADLASRRWSMAMRRALCGVALAVAVGSLAIYGADAVWPRKSQPAFVFVAAPPVSWLLSALVVSTAGLLSRKQE